MPRKKKTEDLICCEEESDNDATKETKGYNHQVQCTNNGCEIWTDVWIPVKVPRKFLERPLYCAFCSAAKLESIDQNHKEEIQNLQYTYAEMTKQDHKKAVIAPSTSDLAREIRIEQKAQVAKENNLVITSDLIGEIVDEQSFIKEIAQDLQIELSPDEFTCTKVGRNKPRILMTLQSTSIRKKLLTASVRLKSLPKWSKTYINPDYTKLEQQQQYNLRCELRQKRLEEPNKRWKIFRNNVVEKNN